MRLSRRRCGRFTRSLVTFVVFVVSMVLCSYITAELQLNHFKREINAMCASLSTLNSSTSVHQQPSPQQPVQPLPMVNGEEITRKTIRGLEPCTLLAGNKRTHKGFLTIGIPSTFRIDKSYLFTTLNSIVENTSDEEKSNVVVVVFLADDDPTHRADTVSSIATNHSQHLASGFLLVVEPPLNAYPTFHNLPRNFNDSTDRVKWRSKQAVDFAYLFNFCKSISRYYLSLDDDVVTKLDFVPAIQAYIDEQQERWVMLEFSYLGTIGKLYKSEDLERLASFFLMFYSEQPVDFLQIYFRLLHTQMKAKVRMPTLFQHVGLQSTLGNKTQPLSDTLFDSSPQKLKGDNPAATIMTTMPNYLDNMPEYPYQQNDDRYFWTNRPASQGDYYTVVFHDVVTLDRVVVHTGSDSHPTDTLLSGNLEISEETKPPWNMIEPCTQFVVVGTFVDGQVDVSGVSSMFPISVKCLRVSVTGSQDSWLIVREVSVFVSDTTKSTLAPIVEHL